MVDAKKRNVSNWVYMLIGVETCGSIQAIAPLLLLQKQAIVEADRARDGHGVEEDVGLRPRTVTGTTGGYLCGKTAKEVKLSPGE